MARPRPSGAGDTRKISEPPRARTVTLPLRVFIPSKARGGIQLCGKVPIEQIHPMDKFQRAQLSVLPGGRGNGGLETPSAGTFDVLVAALAQRDAAAAREAWNQFAPLVFRVLRRMLGSQDVEDVAQGVFLRIFNRISTLRDPQALPAFVLAFTTRTAQWELRKRRLRRLVRVDEASTEGLSVSPNPAAREALGAFYRVLDGLQAADRAVFVLRFMEGLEVKVIADTLNVSESTAKRRIARALERVKAGVRRHPALSEYASAAMFLPRGNEDGHA